MLFLVQNLVRCTGVSSNEVVSLPLQSTYQRAMLSLEVSTNIYSTWTSLAAVRETGSFRMRATMMRNHTRKTANGVPFFPKSLLTSLSRILVHNPTLSCKTALEVNLALRGGMIKTKTIERKKLHASWRFLTSARANAMLAAACSPLVIMLCSWCGCGVWKKQESSGSMLCGGDSPTSIIMLSVWNNALICVFIENQLQFILLLCLLCCLLHNVAC